MITVMHIYIYIYIYIYTCWRNCISVTAVPTGGCNNNLELIVKSYASFTNCISETNKTKKYNAKDLNVVTSVYSLIEYTDNYSNFRKFVAIL